MVVRNEADGNLVPWAVGGRTVPKIHPTSAEAGRRCYHYNNGALRSAYPAMMAVSGPATAHPPNLAVASIERWASAKDGLRLAMNNE